MPKIRGKYKRYLVDNVSQMPRLTRFNQKKNEKSKQAKSQRVCNRGIHRRRRTFDRAFNVTSMHQPVANVIYSDRFEEIHHEKDDGTQDGYPDDILSTQYGY